LSDIKRIALIIGQSFEYGRGTLRGIHKYAQDKPWLLHRQAPDDDALKFLHDWHPSGIIAFFDSSMLPQYQKLGIPLLVLSDNNEANDITRIGTDDIAVGVLAAQHLLARGLANYAYFGTKNYRFSTLREQGFREELARHGFIPNVLNVDYHSKANSSTSRWTPIYSSLREWLKKLPQPVGVMAFNDSGGMAVSDICREMGINVPRDIAIIGVDDDELRCNMAFPPLSSVKLPTEQIGYRAAQMLEHIMESPRYTPITTLLPPVQVVTRQSTDVTVVDDPDIATVLRYIKAHAKEKIDIVDILAQVPLSRRALEQRMRTILHISPLEAIHQAHMELAESLLLNTDEPLATVAQSSGFGSVNSMIRIFMQMHDISPTAYRNINRLPDDVKANRAKPATKKGNTASRAKREK